MVFLKPARVLAVEQPMEVKSQVAAVVWLAHGGSLIRAAPKHLGIPHCVKLTIEILRYLVLHGFDLQNLRRTEYDDLGDAPTES